MDSLVESSLKNSALVLVIITLLYVAIAELKVTERMRIMLVYIFAGFLAFAGSFQLRYICFSALLVPILVLEFLSEDKKRLQMFTKFRYKMIDFAYRMLFEYAYGYFIIAMLTVFIEHRWHGNFKIHFAALSISCILMALTLRSIAAQKFSTKSVTEIIQKLETGTLTYDITDNRHSDVLFSILTSIEDQSYFSRRSTQHTLGFRTLIRKGLKYVLSRKKFNPFRLFRELFSRGYGTIEMQLIRTIGVQNGYQYTYRRKIFELIYSNLIFNGYREYLIREHGNYRLYKRFILQKYLENVDVSINGKLFRSYDSVSSIYKMYQGKSGLNQISNVEFFVWCLGLPRSWIHPGTIADCRKLMSRFNIDENDVYKTIRNISPGTI